MKRHLFATAFVTASLSLGLTLPGQAVVTWFAGVDIPIPTNFEGVYVDLDSGATDTAPFAGGDANFFFGGTGIGNDASAAAAPSWQPVRVAADSMATVANLAPGTLVNSSSLFGSGFGGSSDHIGSQFTAGSQGYIGFSLDSGSGPLYGWMRVTLNPNTSEGTIHTWAIQNNGSEIAVGVPEPGSSLLALLGVGGLLLRRRRR